MPNQYTNTIVSAPDGGDIPTYIATPAEGSGMGVVIVPSIMGVAADIVEWADQLATEGFVVSATDPFWRDEDSGNLEGEEDARERGCALMGRVDQDQNLGDLESLLKDL